MDLFLIDLFINYLLIIVSIYIQLFIIIFMNNYTTKNRSYRWIGIAVLFSSFTALLAITLSGINLYGNSAILALYFTNHISLSSAELSLSALVFPAGFAIKYLLGTAGYEAFIDGTTIIFIRYTVLDVLGFWGWMIPASISGASA